MWDLPGSGIEPMSPVLAGGLFTTEPPGKPLDLYLCVLSVCICVCVSICAHVCIYVSMSVSEHVWMSGPVCVYMCLCVYFCTFAYVCIWVSPSV